MTILLSDLIALFDDDGSMRRVDALLGRVTAAEQAIAAASESIEAIDDELRALGVRTGPDEADEETEEREDDAAVPHGARPSSEDAPPVRRAKPRKKPAMPADDPTDPRSVIEYVNALDEVAHELGATGAAGAAGTGIRGVDIAEAMERRGFPNGKRVLKVARAHPNWSEVDGQRSRFRYVAVVRGEHDAQASCSSDVDEPRDAGADETEEQASPGDGTDHRAENAERVVAVSA